MSINREQWLKDASKLILSQIILPVVTSSNITENLNWQVSCGWPSIRGLAKSNKRIGECWGAAACEDKSTQHIFISPAVEEVIGLDGCGVLPTLTHELVHMLVGTEHGHKKPFRQVAVPVGLQGRMTATHAGEALQEKLVEVATLLGPYPHAALNYERSGRRVQSTRYRKVVCSNCGYTIRVTRKWLAVGPPTCPCGEVMMA